VLRVVLWSQLEVKFVGLVLTVTSHRIPPPPAFLRALPVQRLLPPTRLSYMPVPPPSVADES
jgi:hypothetical protein